MYVYIITTIMIEMYLSLLALRKNDIHFNFIDIKYTRKKKRNKIMTFCEKENYILDKIAVLILNDFFLNTQLRSLFTKCVISVTT